MSPNTVIDGNKNDSDTDAIRECQATQFSVSPVNVIDDKPSFDENTPSNWLKSWTNSQLREMQENDTDIGFILTEKLKSENKPSRSKFEGKSQEMKILFGLWELLVIREGVLYKILDTINQGEILQLVAPKDIRKFIFQQLHGSKLSAHFGRDRTLHLIKNKFYWPNMSESVKRWCQNCELCAKRKPGPGKGKSPLKQSISSAPLERIAIDIMGPLPLTRNGNEYIMVLQDYFTKWSEAYALPNHRAITVADKLVTEFICKFGCPHQIHTDQGREFESNLFHAICDKLGIDKTRTCPYRPQSDGMVERNNRTIQDMLSLFVNERRDDWDDYLPFVTMSYRSTQHDSTKCSPNLLMFGHEIRCPIDIMFGLPKSQANLSCPIPYVEWVQDLHTNR